MIRFLILASIALLAYPTSGARGDETAHLSCIDETTRIFASRSRASSKSFWALLESKFKREVQNSIQSNRALYLDAQSKNHPQIRFLESAGFRFSDPVEVPEIGKVFEYYNTSLQDLVSKGKLSPDDILRPGFVFKNEHNDPRKFKHFIWRGFKDEIPAGYEEVTEVLGDRDFFEMISEGYYPIGSTTRLAIGNHTIMEHDLAHFGGFLDRPEYMAALRRTFKKLRQSHESNPIGLSELFQMTELASWTPLEKRSALLKLLSLPQSVPGQEFFRESEIYNHLSSLSTPELEQLIARFEQNPFAEIITPLGGTTRDMINPPDPRFYSGLIDESWAPFGTHWFPKNLKASLKTSPGYDKSANRDSVLRFLSTYELGVLELSRLTPEEIVEGLGSGSRLDPNSALYRAYCLSGLVASNTVNYLKYCPEKR